MPPQPFPNTIPLKQLLGPSFVILALGLGSGEVILWPYLSSNYGLGIAWAAVLGITCQYFINMEIERYALIKGESIFVGINKISRWAAYWFIVSTFIGFGLPGIIASSAQVFGAFFGITNFKWIAIIFLILIGVILSSGKTVYGLMEKITKTVIVIGVLFILVLTMVIAKSTDWIQLAQGLVGIGNNYHFIPAGINLAILFGAFAYAGAGGNLNLTQSIYIKEKGYGMGKYSQKISGLFKNIGKQEKIKLTGENFDLNPENISMFKKWWRLISTEHALVFLGTGALAICLLMVLSYSTTHDLPGNTQGIGFVINEGLAIGSKLTPWIGSLFLMAVAIMLFQTQMGVLDSTSRIMAENYALKKIERQSDAPINLSKIYFFFIWSQIAFGCLLFLFNFYEPKTLLVTGAVINALAMPVHIALTHFCNRRLLPRALQPGLMRVAIITIIFLIYIAFGVFTFADKLL